MNHGITSNEWERYLAGALPPTERDRLEAHLIGCVSCWEFHQRLAALNAKLLAAGEAQGDSFALTDEKLQAALRNVFARIHASHAQENPNPVQQRLDEVAAVITVFCGEQAAAKALQAAAAHSPAKSLKQVTLENWEPFLQRLTDIAQVLCGRTGARWLLYSGRF